ncbi:DUF6708 domain-containing protein [Pseudoduganella sp.]|uniref:DUF6708 domain-containing protein n=1 Tax=Pseudoduganella sp. TaxID=1880898 RepID=UPI0035AE0F9A
MDERIFPRKLGEPVPEWERNHRLPINGRVGPTCSDDGTIFRRNRVYMDVCDQPFCSRQWIAAAVLVAIVGAFVGLYFSVLPFYLGRIDPKHLSGVFLLVSWSMLSMLGFGYAAFYFGRDEFFSLTRRTLRFHRLQKKLFIVRRRRFFAKTGEGDIFWEVPWSDETIFCVHAGKKNGVRNYQIVGYILDGAGNVDRAFAIGKDWEGSEGLENLLAQWNYYCSYMNEGPEATPEPMLYLAEEENFRESFLHCMYEFGHSAGLVFRVVLMPAFLVLTGIRVLALATCRPPIWPAEVERLCVISENDPHTQPSGETPVGWAATVVAKHHGKYPSFPQREVAAWSGPGSAENARLWSAELSPLNYAVLYPAEVV